MDLVQWQNDLVESVINDSTANSVQTLHPRQLAVYRHNVSQGLINALKTSYPICLMQMGNSIFNELAKAYIKSHPPTQPNLNDYGVQLSDFITSHGVDYEELFSDLARLDWQRQISFYAADDKPLTQQQLAQLAAISETRYSELQLILRQDLSVLSSHFNLTMVWKQYQAGRHSNKYTKIKHLDRQSRSYYYCLYRKPYHVVVDVISEQDFTILQALKQGKTLGQLSELVGGNNVENHLPHYMSKQFITGFGLQQGVTVC